MRMNLKVAIKRLAELKMTEDEQAEDYWQKEKQLAVTEHFNTYFRI